MLEKGYFFRRDKVRIQITHTQALGSRTQYREIEGSPHFWFANGKRSDGDDSLDIFMRDPYQFKNYPAIDPPALDDVVKMVTDAYVEMGVAPDRAGLDWWVQAYREGQWGNPGHFLAAFKAAFANAAK